MGACLTKPAAAGADLAAPERSRPSEERRSLERLGMQMDRVERHNRRLRDHLHKAQAAGLLPQGPALPPPA